MTNRIRRGLFAAAGLIGGLVAQPARADGEIEKPPGVPPEVTAAKTACPTLTGPCHGFYPTRWRVLSDCCATPAGPVVPAPVPVRRERPRPRRGSFPAPARPPPGGGPPRVINPLPAGGGLSPPPPPAPKPE